MKHNPREVVNDCRCNNEYHILIVPAHIEVVAGQQEKHPSVLWLQHKIECHHHREEENKLKGIK